MSARYLDEPIAPDEALDGRARPFQEFLEDDTHNYQEDIVRMLNLNHTRLIVDLDHLRAYNKELATAYVHPLSSSNLATLTPVQRPKRAIRQHPSV